MIHLVQVDWLCLIFSLISFIFYLADDATQIDQDERAKPTWRLYVSISAAVASALLLVTLIFLVVRRKRNQPIYDLPNGKFRSEISGPMGQVIAKNCNS